MPRGMVMRKITYILVLAMIFLLGAAEEENYLLRWDIPENNRLEVMNTATVQYLENGRLRRVYQERNIIDLTCYKRDEEKQFVRGRFKVYRRDSREKLFRLEEEYNAEFAVTERGYYIVPETHYMPNFRHMPMFPEQKVAPGDSWKAPVHIKMNNFSMPLLLVLESSYFFEKVEEKDGKKTAIINYTIPVDKDLREKRFPTDIPLKIIGQYTGTLEWNISENRPVESENRYNIMMLFARGKAGASIEFKMAIKEKNKIYDTVSKKDKKKQKEELEKEIPEDSGITVDEEKRGLVLRLGEILFGFDKYTLRDDSENNLEKITGIIKKKYPDREIIVEGHTDNIGEKKYNQELSEKRARSVAEYLGKRLGHDKISFRGLGQDEPIADNSTREGRKKNRRVEIIIKLN